jgi:hypothetical protein
MRSQKDAELKVGLDQILQKDAGLKVEFDQRLQRQVGLTEGVKELQKRTQATISYKDFAALGLGQQHQRDLPLAQVVEEAVVVFWQMIGSLASEPFVSRY